MDWVKLKWKRTRLWSSKNDQAGAPLEKLKCSSETKKKKKKSEVLPWSARPSSRELQHEKVRKKMCGDTFKQHGTLQRGGQAPRLVTGAWQRGDIVARELKRRRTKRAKSYVTKIMEAESSRQEWGARENLHNQSWKKRLERWFCICPDFKCMRAR